MITLSDISLYRGTERLLNQTNLTIHAGHKVGLVGKNGCGKSSLFALLRGELSVDSGELSLPRHWQIASVAQETPALDCSALDYVLDGDREFRQLERELTEAERSDDGHKIAELHTRIEIIGGYSAKARAATLLHGLGFADAELANPVSAFSGGWRMRLNLAQALMCRSDLLLLDEPTNHLDLDAVIWLGNWLNNYPGTLLLISHDRDFLDQIIEEIVHIEHNQLNLYQGGYSDYERQRAEKLSQQQHLFEKQQRSIAHMQKYVDRFRYKASKARQAQSRLKAIEKMELIAPAHVDSPFQFEFKPAPSLPNPLLKLEQITAGYQLDKPILEEVKFSLIPGSRIGLLGRNGAGKSTLIKLLAGELAPQNGELALSPGVRIGYFSQHQLETLRVDMGPLQQLALLAPNATEQQLRNYLGGFDFSGDKVFEPVETFSGGEKARLVLALIIWQRPNLLLLDEPTNHLDLEMRQALTLALQAYEGALVLVSHDRHLLRSVTDELYLVNAQRVSPFDGDLDDYYRWLTDPATKNNTKSQPEQNSPEPTLDRKQRKRMEAEFRSEIGPLKKRLQQLEKAMDKEQSQLESIEQQLAESDIYEPANKMKLQEALDLRTRSQQALAQHEEEWLELEHEIDARQQAFEAQLSAS
ncbi:ABC transporter ATP-binding protein [Dongshaea marina]|uniref:ABC transporter ATP-binding protein n=1 Tax=Dongshaea marina TaxID=2047966 RepID=UPI000D3E779F|nr:ABC transporter ATP-binding protein [Dongshaea marina]